MNFRILQLSGIIENSYNLIILHIIIISYLFSEQPVSYRDNSFH